MQTLTTNWQVVAAIGGVMGGFLAAGGRIYLDRNWIIIKLPWWKKD